MVEIPSEIMKLIEEFIKLIEEFIKLIKEDNIQIEKVILFGSYANGTYNEDSDIDLAIISHNFKAEECVNNMSNLLLKANKLKADIQILPFSVKEYNEPIGIMEEILRTGVEIVA